MDPTHVKDWMNSSLDLGSAWLPQNKPDSSKDTIPKRDKNPVASFADFPEPLVSSRPLTDTASSFPDPAILSTPITPAKDKETNAILSRILQKHNLVSGNARSSLLETKRTYYPTDPTEPNPPQQHQGTAMPKFYVQGRSRDNSVPLYQRHSSPTRHSRYSGISHHSGISGIPTKSSSDKSSDKSMVSSSKGFNWVCNRSFIAVNEQISQLYLTAAEKLAHQIKKSGKVGPLLKSVRYILDKASTKIAQIEKFERDEDLANELIVAIGKLATSFVSLVINTHQTEEIVKLFDEGFYRILRRGNVEPTVSTSQELVQDSRSIIRSGSDSSIHIFESKVSGLTSSKKSKDRSVKNTKNKKHKKDKKHKRTPDPTQLTLTDLPRVSSSKNKSSVKSKQSTFSLGLSDFSSDSTHRTRHDKAKAKAKAKINAKTKAKTKAKNHKKSRSKSTHSKSSTKAKPISLELTSFDSHRDLFGRSDRISDLTLSGPKYGFQPTNNFGWLFQKGPFKQSKEDRRRQRKLQKQKKAEKKTHPLFSSLNRSFF